MRIIRFPQKLIGSLDVTNWFFFAWSEDSVLFNREEQEIGAKHYAVRWRHQPPNQQLVCCASLRLKPWPRDRVTHLKKCSWDFRKRPKTAHGTGQTCPDSRWLSWRRWRRRVPNHRWCNLSAGRISGGFRFFHSNSWASDRIMRIHHQI